MGTILLVCTGNICRSPMAEGILRERLTKEGLAGRHQVASAGIWAVDEAPASPNGVSVMAEKGVDITGHIAHTITAADVAESDLILVMSREHKQAILNTWPQYDWKVFRLSEMIGKRQDVWDPYGGDMDEYRASAELIGRYIDEGFQRILELV